MDFLKENISIILKVIIIILLIAIIYLIIVIDNQKQTTESEISMDISEPKVENITDNIHVDIKGSILNPGVYELPSNSLINDAIIASGGLTTNATTKYTNLSKKLQDEMVIYIYNEKEIEELEKSNQKECICSNPIINNLKTETKTESNEEINDSKVSINTASKEELMTLNGIGESKATAIIKYRTENGLFTKIEDIDYIISIFC